MQLKYLCNHCKYEFIGCDRIPGAEEQVCPRCNWGTHNWLFSPMDASLGKPYVYFATWKEMRLGRETRQLRNEGLWRFDFGTKDVERGETYIPRFGVEPAIR